MSDVRLSNASPTLERVDARQPDSVRPAVRRRLFGAPDGEEIRRDLEVIIQNDAQRFRETYNYDPVNDRPLPAGNYEWQEDSDAPEYFSRPPHRSQRPRRQEDVHGDRPATRNDSRKRPSNDSGPCSSEQSSKNPRPNGDDDDDDEDQSNGGAAQALETASRPEVQ